VPAAWLEQEVVLELFKLLGNPAAIHRSIKAAVPDADDAMQRRQRLMADIESVKRARQSVLNLCSKGVTSEDEAATQLQGLQERLVCLQGELDRLEATLVDVPSEEDIQCFVDQIGSSIVVFDQQGNMRAGGNDVQSYLLMTHADKKALLNAVFSGPLVDGKPGGVYVSYDRHSRRADASPWRWYVKGRLDFQFGNAKFASS
jgi:hypothetical protein